MSRVAVHAEVRVYEKDDGGWGCIEEKIAVETYWNDERGQYAVLVVGKHRYTVVVSDFCAALTAVTTR